jgi:hypothetical protein
MFKNRQVEVRVRKDDKTKTETTLSVEDELKRKEAYTRFAQKIIITAAVAVYGYVVVDTFRQTMVAVNTNNPE